MIPWLAISWGKNRLQCQWSEERHKKKRERCVLGHCAVFPFSGTANFDDSKRFAPNVKIWRQAAVLAMVYAPCALI